MFISELGAGRVAPGPPEPGPARAEYQKIFGPGRAKMKIFGPGRAKLKISGPGQLLSDRMR